MLLHAKHYDHGDSIVLVLADCHQERTGAIYQRVQDWAEYEIPDYTDSDGKPAKTHKLVASCYSYIIWDPFQIEQTTSDLGGWTGSTADVAEQIEHALELSFDRLFPRMLEHYGELGGSYGDKTHDVWVRLEGDIPGLTKVFNELTETMLEPTGGDDDTYDYWPSGFDLLTMFARDLDLAFLKLGRGETTQHIDKARMVWDHIAIDLPEAPPRP